MWVARAGHSGGSTLARNQQGSRGTSWTMVPADALLKSLETTKLVRQSKFLGSGPPGDCSTRYTQWWAVDTLARG